MIDFQETRTLEPPVAVERITRVPGRDTALALLLTTGGGDVVDVTIQRSMNPALFDFMVKHVS